MENIIISVIGGFVSIVTCIIANRTSKKIDANHDAMNEVLLDMIRNDIVEIYYQYKDVKKIPYYVRESLDKLYSCYERNGGNTFVSDIYKNEMRHWEVIR